MHKLIFICCGIIFSSTVCAQDLIYTKKTISDLTAERMHGRGYVKNGCNIAGAYLEKQFIQIGLQPLNGKDFRQLFSFPVNTFPKSAQLSVNGKAIVCGAEFIVDAASTSCNYKDVKLTYDSVSKAYISTQFPLKLKIQPKLTFSLSKIQNAVTDFFVLKDTSQSWQIRQSTINVSAKLDASLIADYSVFNVAGVIKGKQYPDSFIVLSAHYDHLGRLGKKVYFPGANDNASGVSMLLSIAKTLKSKPNKYSIVFILFAGEEIGLIGSKYFVDHSLIDLKKIKFLVNLDLNGTGDEGATVVNSTIYTKQFEQLKTINDQEKYLPQLKTRGKAFNSDHYWFSEKGVPAFFIYTMGGISAYHDIYDKAETLPLTKYKELHQLLLSFIQQL